MPTSSTRTRFEFAAALTAAARLFDHLARGLRYLGVDISETMVALARERLRPWANRAEVVRPKARSLGSGAGAYDRFVSTYVLDLMSEEAIRAVLADAHRLLGREGLLCLVSLTHGHGVITKLISSAWTMLHRLKPTLVGGCRPIELRDYLAGDRWRVQHHELVSAWGITSEVLVASRLAS
jgi:ubiquinone/menaquinone biosynthesis C-methylase UbiE